MLDRIAISRFGIPGFRLMQRAGHAAFAELVRQWPQARQITIVCGAGNNGGDGLIVAGLALQAGLSVQLLTLGDNFAERLRGEALQAWQWLSATGIEYRRWQPRVELEGEVIVDALLGTGLNGDVRGEAALLIEQINRSPAPVLSIDIPSGLSADTGAILGVAVKADVTVTFIGLKQGLLTHQGVDYCGELKFDSLRVPEAVFEEVAVSAFRTSAEDQQALLPTRNRSAHKGNFGHLLVVGGNLGFGGAALMAAQAALRTGAGLVSLATHPDHVSAALTRVPELMCRGIEDAEDLDPLLERATAVVCGPGLGQDEWSRSLLDRVLSSGKPLLFDADALNLLAHPDYRQELAALRVPYVMTPHPGEAARMLETDVPALLADRFESVGELQAEYGGTVVLKGAGSLSCDGDVMHLCSAGNPGMATGGMGDVLSGVIGALLAQRLSAIDAARLGVRIHALAGDYAAGEGGERGLQATDLLPWIRRVVNDDLPETRED